MTRRSRAPAERVYLSLAPDLVAVTASESDGRWRGRVIHRGFLCAHRMFDCHRDDDSEAAAMDRARLLAAELFPRAKR